MLAVLANRTYRHLLLAQVIALVGTGLATVALGLLAYNIAGGNAGAVLGTALAIKMVAYIGIAPIAGAFADRVPRRALLVSLDLVRAAVALCLPFVSEIWQIYILIFVLQAASAAFTPTFQATIPDVLPDERDYTRALSLSRLAYDMENITSPILAAGLLTVINFHWLFSGTAIGFIGSALLVVTVILPRPERAAERQESVYAKTTRGMRIYLKTPRLRGLLAITLAAAAASSMVIVNTVVIVQSLLNMTQRDVAFTLAAYGAGSITAALLLPRMLDKISDRLVMIGAAIALSIGLAAMTWVSFAVPVGRSYWHVILIGWAALGIAYSMSVTPSGRLLKRSANAEDRPALFAAQFALSHVCWLICYPLVGQLGANISMSAAFGAMCVIAAIGTLLAFLLWPSEDPDVVPHVHDDLPPGHEHLRVHHGGDSAAHVYMIDDLHRRWTKQS
ncbi:MAG: MFS transporter [Novosphingobium sp. 28-62-57]|uniref:MFS transporter n=1 Tax=Novosphingobium sp. 28-62-57 TaxID=1970409 RepID=UPI000BDD82A8|nr:MFS transporter [Novosphingobium sp. 28-62-57]OYZ07919.1 MAG: MFS transporter [Novosphingobium sp. 28-62-57]